MKHDVSCIVIPVFGASIGGVSLDVAARRMLEGYLQIKNRSGAKYDF